jgi:integrase
MEGRYDMATLLTTKSGASCVQYYDGRNRKTITLPLRFNKKTAGELKPTVERLIFFRDNVQPVDKRTLTWVETAPDIIREKLAAVGLIQALQKQTCQELWDTYLAEKTGVKESTIDIYDRAQNEFFLFFDKDRQISSLKSSDILEWKRHMQGYLAESTTASMFAKAKAVFNGAVEKRWLEVSPLQGIGGGSYDNDENDRFIEVEEYNKLLDVCPCQEWRMIITLARIGGLRCPSEAMRLRWNDIHWDKNLFKVTSPKLEHHKGKGWRYVPLFPEVRRDLEALRSMYGGKQPEYVINRYDRDQEPNLGTQFARIARAAGLGKIPCPFNNMRGSRATEIYAAFGEKIEAAWLGHCKRIALKHYLMVRKGDYAKAANLELTELSYL